MRCLLLAPSVIVLTVGLLAQQPVQSPDKMAEHPAASCIVSGRVVTAEDGTPLKSALIALLPNRSASQTHTYSAISDGDGRFLIKDVAPESYSFLASRAGFVEQRYQENRNGGEAVLSLKAGDRISDVLFRLTRAAVIAGRVTNEDGEAMNDVRVVVLRAPTQEELEEESPARSRNFRPASAARTDDRGQYRVFGLNPGEYYIQETESFEPDGNMPVPRSYWLLRDLGSEYGAVYYPGVPQVSQAQTVSIRPGEEVQADISMQRTKTVDVAGRVIGPNGPTKGTLVQLETSGVDGLDIDRSSETDDKGNFTLKKVPPGSYVIAAYQQEEGEGVFSSRGRKTIDVGSENIEGLVISVGGVNLQGRVIVTGPGVPPFARLAVALVGGDDGRFAGQAHVKQDGTFELKGIVDGRYALHLFGLGGEWYVKSARLASDDILDQGAQIDKSSASAKFEVVISSATAQVEGSVQLSDGPAVGARVRVVPEPETAYNHELFHSTNTDQTGHFSITGVAPGTYRVLARTTAPADGILRSEPQIVTLSEHEHKTVQLTIKP